MARRTLRNLDERIIKLTIHYGAIGGIEGIQTKRMAKDLGITEPTIYVHFKTKENLLFEAYKNALATIYGASALKDPSEPLEETIISVLALSKEHPEEAIYSFYYRHYSKRKELPPANEGAIRVIAEGLAKEKTTGQVSLIPTAMQVLTFFTYRVAKGVAAADKTTAHALLCFLLGGLS